MNRRSFAALAALAFVAPTARVAFAEEKLPTTWDKLVKVDSKKLQAVYLLPGADFRAYKSVKLDPAEVAFRKNWMQDINDDAVGLTGRIDQSQVTAIANAARTGIDQIFAKAFVAAGYPVVTAAGPTVLLVRTAIANLSVAAPDLDSTYGRQYSADAGDATLIVEVRDSTSMAVLGRAVDAEAAGYNTGGMRTRASNREDFSILFKHWAQMSTNGLNTLKELSPVSATAK